MSRPHRSGAGQEVVAQDGRQGNGDQEGGGERHHIGKTQGLQQPPLHPGEEKERQKHQDDDEGGKNDGRLNLQGGREDHPHRPPPILGRARRILAQAPGDVLHIDDGIVHQGADGNGHATERHGVDAGPQGIKDQDGGQQGQGDSQDRDGRGRGTPQEGEDDHQNHDSAVAQGHLHMGDRRLDEVRLAEEPRFDQHARRQASLELGHEGVEAFGQGQGIGPGLLLNGEHHRRVAVGRGRAAGDGGTDAHPREVGDADRYAIAQIHDRRGDIVRAVHPPQAIDQILLPVLDQKTGGGVLIGLAQGRADLIEADAIVGQLHRIDQHLILAGLATRDDHLRHPGNGQQLPAQVPVRDRLEGHEVIRGTPLGTQGDEHHLPHDGGHRGQDRRRNLRGEGGPGGLEVLRHDLAGPRDIGPPAKLHPDHGRTDAGGGADATHPGGAVKGGLDGQGDQGLHFGGRKPRGLGEYRDRGRGEIWKHIHRHGQGAVKAVTQEQQGGSEHEKSVLQGPANEGGNHDGLSVGMAMTSLGGGPGGQMHQIGATTHHPLPRGQALGNGHIIAIAQPGAHQPARESLAAGLHIDGITPRIVDQGTGRYGQGLLFLAGKDPGVDRLTDPQPGIRAGKLEDDGYGAALRVNQGPEGHQARPLVRGDLEGRSESWHLEPGTLGLANGADVRLGDAGLEPEPLGVHEMEEPFALLHEATGGNLDLSHQPPDGCPHRHPRRLALRGPRDLRQALAGGREFRLRHLLGTASLEHLPIGDGTLLPEGIQALALLTGQIPGRSRPRDAQLQARHIGVTPELGYQIGHDLALLHRHPRVGKTPGRGPQVAVDRGSDLGLAIRARPQQSRGGHGPAQQARRGDRGGEVRPPLLFLEQDHAAFLPNILASRGLGGQMVGINGEVSQVMRILDVQAREGDAHPPLTRRRWGHRDPE